MTKKEILNTCKLLYATHYIPIACYTQDDKLCAFFCSYKNYEKVMLGMKKQIPQDETARFVTGIAGLYGAVRIPEHNLTLITGPFVNKKITNEMFDSIIHTYGFDWSELQPLKQFLFSLPRHSLNRFLNFIALLHYLFNKKESNIIDYYNKTSPQLQQSLGERYVDNLLDENTIAHNTYNIEKQLLSYVTAGDVPGLSAFFDKIIQGQPMIEGKVADDPLRQSKNIFIGLICMVGKVGAIRGNLDIEQTFQMIDIYTQECERCTSIEEVNQLRYASIIDFTRRVAELKHPQTFSKEVYKAMQYIKTHTNQQITVQDVIDHVRKSRSVFMHQFRTETGETIGRYIIKAKLQEAKLLLAYSDRSLPAISNFLFFSSQSHFQNAFKKEFGLTPLEYRKKHHKE